MWATNEFSGLCGFCLDSFCFLSWMVWVQLGLGLLNCFLFFFLRHVTHSPPLPLEISRECPWCCWFASNLQKSRGTRGGGGGQRGRGIVLLSLKLIGCH